jgi:imidazolonepropionase-like amidohydrolase
MESEMRFYISRRALFAQASSCGAAAGVAAGSRAANRFIIGARQWALAIAVTLTTSGLQASPAPPGAPQDRPIALIGGVIHPVSQPEIKDGMLLFDGGKIVAVGKDVALPANVEKIELNGSHVYPGFIDAFTQLGLVEIPMIKATADHSELGRINPNVQARTAINPDSETIPIARSGGVLTVLTIPGGGLVTGTSALVQLDGWTSEDMTFNPAVAVHLRWPQMAPVHTWWQEMSAQEQLQSRDKALVEIRRALTDARAYHRHRKARANSSGRSHDFDARWESFVPVLEGKMPLVVDADEIQQIQSAVAFCEHEKLKLIIAGGYDAPECAELLKKHQVPVIVGGVHRLPRRHDDSYDAPFTLPARLRDAGVAFCISSAERPSMVRNLAHHAGTAAAFGLKAEEAIRAITLSAAEIVGAADRLGSLDAGKDATLIVSSDDPLEVPSQVTMAFIQGRKVELDDRQKRLWEKYKEKYRRQGIE